MKQRRITWRHIFNILERTYDLHQPVMISVRLTMAANSHEQLLWLLGVRQTISLLVWSNDRDDVTDWHGILALREFTASDRIVYDLAKQHHDVLHSFGIFSQL
uniref:Menorin-like domain-containing protein n=1 Tax=Plectus sambesii TaxID=2011161 RepID=A0A914VG88_9BILA